MYYEILVIKDGRHFFATAERSITTPAELDTVYKALEKAFPAKDGFKLSVTRWEQSGTIIDMASK